MLNRLANIRSYKYYGKPARDAFECISDLRSGAFLPLDARVEKAWRDINFPLRFIYIYIRETMEISAAHARARALFMLFARFFLVDPLRRSLSSLRSNIIVLRGLMAPSLTSQILYLLKSHNIRRDSVESRLFTVSIHANSEFSPSRQAQLLCRPKVSSIALLISRRNKESDAYLLSSVSRSQ